VVTRLDLGDAGADLLDNAGALVAADDREPRDQVAVDQVQVGVAEPGGDVPDQDLAVLGASRSSSMISNGLCASCSTASLVFMGSPRFIASVCAR
jgi:hypothetical protein